MPEVVSAPPHDVPGAATSLLRENLLLPCKWGSLEEPAGPCVSEAPARQRHHPLRPREPGKLRHGLGMGTGVRRAVLSRFVNR